MADELQVTEPERVRLERLEQRVRMVLLCAEGRTNAEIAEEVGASQRTVQEWLARYEGEGLGGLLDRRPGRPRKVVPEDVKDRLVYLIERTRPPPNLGDRWTYDLLLEAIPKLGSKGRISRILKDRWVDVPLHLQQTIRYPFRTVQMRIRPRISIPVSACMKMNIQMAAEERGMTLPEYVEERISDAEPWEQPASDFVLARLIGQAPTLAESDPWPELEYQALDRIRDRERQIRWRRAILERPVGATPRTPLGELLERARK